MTRKLSIDDRVHLFEHGYVIVRRAIGAEALSAARTLISEAIPSDENVLLVPGKLATDDRITGLFNDSDIASILRNAMGPFPEAISCQIAVTPPYTHVGGEPFLHVDGGWDGPLPDSADEIDTDSWRPIDAERWFGVNDDMRGSNDGLLWVDRDRRLSYGSYTAIVGIALNDQLEPGNGQFGVLDGAHELVEQCFRKQRDAGGVIGPEGPGWPRVHIDRDGKPRANGLPDAVREEAERRRQEGKATNDWPWPQLTPVCLGAGDAVIALHSCPHAATPNLGPNPRMNVYFRIRRLRVDNPNEGTRRVAHGVSDHPDRGYFGQFLDYPEGFDPFQISIDALCDHWSEWDGVDASR